MDPQIDDSNISTRARLRAWSASTFDRLRRSPSRGNEQSKEGIRNAIGQAGVLSGAVGSPFVQQEMEVKKGTYAFMQELEKVASQFEPDPRLRRTGTITLEETPLPTDQSHPITDAIDNPFAPQNDTISVDSYDFKEDIYVFNNDAKFFARAMLDTGSDRNLMSRSKAQECGFHIGEYTGGRVRDADGPDVNVLGQVQMQFHFRKSYSAKTWTLDFLIIENDWFDVAFGWPFIKHANLLVKPGLILPFEFDKESKDRKKAREDDTRRINAENTSRKQEEEAGYEARKKPDKARRERDRNKKR